MIILRPSITEKSTDLAQASKYVFKIFPKTSTKKEIAEAVEKQFKVKVTRVNVLKIQSKARRRGYTKGKTQEGKKAIVTLKKGDKIELFEGV